MATNFSPCKGSYVLNQFPSNVMFGMNGFHVSASGAIQGHHGPLFFCIKTTKHLEICKGMKKLSLVGCIDKHQKRHEHVIEYSRDGNE